MRILKIINSAIICAVFVIPVFGQVTSDYTFTGAPTAGLAGAVVANPGSETSLFHNPAGLAEVDFQFISLGNNDIFGVSYNYLGLLIDTPFLGKTGISLQLSETKSGSATLSKEQTIGFSKGFYLQNDKNSQLMLGYTINYLSLSQGRSAGVSGDGSDGLPAASGATIGVDIGVQAVLRGKHRVGAYLKNVNSPTLGDGGTVSELPRRLSIGVAYTPYKKLITSLMMDRLIGGQNIQIKGGVQYGFSSNATLRIGLQSNPNRFGGGINISFQKFNLDYALLTHPVLPVIHHISLGFSF